MNKDKKKVFIRSFGCKMNFRDSEFVMGMMLEDGFEKAASIDDADVILFNSCSVRKHAEDRLFSNIAGLADLKKSKPNLVVGLIGCTAQNYKDKILEKAPLVDLVCGPGNESELQKIIRDILKNRCPIIATDKINEKRAELFPTYREGPFKAYVSISEGCDNLCSYCIVPYVRGRERSRRADDIIKEVKELASRGFKEVMLLGQNVNSYNGTGFVRLLEEINKVKGIERIRFTTSHPKDASKGLFSAMRNLEKVCKHLHLPLQSGSDRVLRLMNRGYTRRIYIRLIEEYKKALPKGAITTDIIVGFPTETEEDFIKTYDLMKDVRFDSAYIYKYSPRPHTEAAKLPDDVPKAEKERRHGILLNFQKDLKNSLVVICILVLSAFSLQPSTSYAESDLATVEKLFLEARYEACAREAQSLIDAKAGQRDELYYLKALSELKNNNFKEARQTFEEMISKHPRSKRRFEADIGIGDTYFLEGDYGQAARIYNEISDTFSNDKNLGIVYYKLGEVYTKLKLPDKAKEYFDKVAKVSPLGFESRIAKRTMPKSNFMPRDAVQADTTSVRASIQVGCFKSKKNASQLSRKLLSQGYESHVEVAGDAGNRLYRVKVGRDMLKKEVEALTMKLKKEGYPTKICR